MATRKSFLVGFFLAACMFLFMGQMGYTPSLSGANIWTNTNTFNSDIVYGDTYWDDARGPATILLVGVGAGNAADRATDGSLLFDTAQDEEAFMIVQMPHGYKLGTNIFPHVHWAKTTSAAGTVVWKIGYQCRDIGETFPGSYTDLTLNEVEQTDSDTANKHAVHSNATGIAPNFGAVSGVCFFRIWRDVSEDNYAADAKLIEFDVHHQISSPGSDNE